MIDLSKEVKQEATGADGREHYVSPAITRIKLSGDEMASAGCKSTMVGNGVCNRGGFLVNLNQGS